MRFLTPFPRPLTHNVRGTTECLWAAAELGFTVKLEGPPKVARPQTSDPTAHKACAGLPGASPGTYLRMKRSTVELLATVT